MMQTYNILSGSWSTIKPDAIYAGISMNFYAVFTKKKA